jgi:hypothetical protein
MDFIKNIKEYIFWELIPPISEKLCCLVIYNYEWWEKIHKPNDTAYY